MLNQLLKMFGYEKAQPQKAPTEAPQTVDSVKICAAASETLKALKTKHLNQIEAALEKVPTNAQFSGSAFVLEADEVKLVELTSKNQAIDLVQKARKGECSLVF